LLVRKILEQTNWYPAKGNFFLQCLYAKLAAIRSSSRMQGTWKDWWHPISREIKFAALCRWGFGQLGAMVSLVASFDSMVSGTSPVYCLRYP